MATSHGLKSGLRVLTAAVMAALVLGACGSEATPTGTPAGTQAAATTQPSGGAAEPTGSPADSKPFEGTTLNVLVSAGHQQFNPVWEAALPEWQAKTGINVQLQKVSTTEILGTFLRDQQIGGCTIDNVEMLDDGFAATAPFMEDLTPYLEREGSSVAALTDAQAGQSVKSMTFNDQLKFYPFYSGGKAIAYRKDLLEDPAKQAEFQTRFGYALPLPPTTPQQVVDLATFFTDGSTKGIVFSGKGDSAEGTVSDLIFRAGVAGYQDEEGNALWGTKYPENQAKVEEAMKWLTGLISGGLTPANIPAMQTADTTAEYLAGNVAMLYDHIYLTWDQITSPESVAAIGETGSFEMPNLAPDSAGIAFRWARAITGCSENKDAAWEFMKFVMSEEMQKLALTDGIGVYVPTDKALMAWAVEQGILPKGVADTVTNARYYKMTPVTYQYHKVIDIPLVEQLIGGQMTPEQYATESARQLQQAAEDAGLVPPAE